MTRNVRSHVFRGHRWQIRHCAQARKGVLGECVDYGLGAAGRVLYAPTDGDTLDELDTIIHEALHAATELDEDAVAETASDIARLLWRLGWRLDGDG